VKKWLAERLGSSGRGSASGSSGSSGSGGSGSRGGGGGLRAPSTVPGVSFAYVLGWSLVMLLAVEAITGAALAAFYAPSTTDAWASVAYVQDRMPGGWFVRGLHVHGASALVIICGLHLVQTALYGAYKRPRELTWWLGILLLLLVLGFTITGYVLRWDQAGYWANQVEIGIAAGTPIVGGMIKKLAIGGNEYGNLTLTRFYALHVIVLPALFVLAAIGHVVLAKRHGLTPRWDRRGARDSKASGVARWPRQSLRDVIAMALVLSVLLAYVVSRHGADLAAPADPAAAYDARPLWYFRWLFALRAIAGSAEQIAAMVAPAIVAGFLIALPLLDRSPIVDPRKRLPWLGALAGVLVIIAALTATSFLADAGDEALAKRQHQEEMHASRARAIAAANGVPATGPQDLFTTAPMYRARTLYAQRCEGCHDAASKDRKGPIIAAGFHTRAWIKGFLLAPSGDAYWGKTKLAKTEDAMKPVDMSDTEVDELTEILYAQTGATDVDAAKRDRGKAIFDNACTDCHSLDEGIAGGSGPGLANLGSRDWFTSFVGNPKAAIHLGTDHSEMPRFDKDLSIVDRDLLAEYLVWLRTATQRDVDALGPL
jgi:ubiquinol-cytochrome c reductase cytochrome b subunit